MPKQMLSLPVRLEPGNHTTVDLSNLREYTLINDSAMPGRIITNEHTNPLTTSEFIPIDPGGIIRHTELTLGHNRITIYNVPGNPLALMIRITGY